MLQQTQVKTVIPYYGQWIKKFPNVASLAKAPLDGVLKCWSGLGYYLRARNIHRTAKWLLRNREGKFPDSVEELCKLPGIGAYTAGAIASIAFGKPEPVLDGNVMRVLSRVFVVKEPVDQMRGRNKLWEIARDLLVGAGFIPPEGAMNCAPTSRRLNRLYGDFNQALMELGAMVCLPENPRCPVCPLQKLCKAHRLKREEDFPVKSRRQKLEKLRTLAAVIWKRGDVLIEKQPLEKRWGGLWAFPHWVHRNGKSELEFLDGQTKKNLGIQIKKWRPLSEIHHGFTKYNVRLRVYEGSALDCGRGVPLPLQVWVDPARLPSLPFPSPHRKIAQLIQDNA